MKKSIRQGKGYSAACLFKSQVPKKSKELFLDRTRVIFNRSLSLSKHLLTNLF